MTLYTCFRVDVVLVHDPPVEHISPAEEPIMAPDEHIMAHDMHAYDHESNKYLDRQVNELLQPAMELKPKKEVCVSFNKHITLLCYLITSLISV